MLKSYSFTLVKSLCVVACISNSAFAFLAPRPGAFAFGKKQSSKSQDMQKQVMPAALLKCQLKSLPK